MMVNIDDYRYNCRHRNIHLHSIESNPSIWTYVEAEQQHRLKPRSTFISMAVNIDDYRYKCRHRNIHLHSIESNPRIWTYVEAEQQHRLEPGSTFILNQGDRITRRCGKRDTTRTTSWRRTDRGWKIVYHQGDLVLMRLPPNTPSDYD